MKVCPKADTKKNEESSISYLKIFSFIWSHPGDKMLKFLSLHKALAMLSLRIAGYIPPPSNWQSQGLNIALVILSTATALNVCSRA